MFDYEISCQAADGTSLAGPALEPDLAAKPPVPLERLEAQLCEVAGHLAAATCRFLVLLAEFDERRGWASWEMSSCAAWLSWKCQMSSGTAREHVRVARALRNLPVIRREFAAARLSYVKVRALTRIATPVTEEQLAVMAGPMTGNQLERFARAHRQCSRADDAKARVRRRLTWRFEEDGSLSGSFRLPPLDGAVLLKALRAAAADLELPGGAEPAGVSAETPPPAAPAADPASPDRCHVEDGEAISVTTAQMLTCTAALSWMRHARDGKILDLGRRRRRPDKALRKAARERDRGRCRFPGCESRKVDLHHIQYWSNGGRTCLENLISLCRRHHTAVHDRGYLIAASPDGSFAFFQPDGTPLPPSPPLPAPGGTIAGVHDAEITPETIIPPWYGERLDLDYAIYTCLANERVYQNRAVGCPPRAGIPPCDCHPGEPADAIGYFREYYARHPEERRRPAAPAQIPVPV